MTLLPNIFKFYALWTYFLHFVGEGDAPALVGGILPHPSETCEHPPYVDNFSGLFDGDGGGVW